MTLGQIEREEARPFPEPDRIEDYRDLNYDELVELTADALMRGDLLALASIAATNWIVASRVISKGDFQPDFINSAEAHPARAVHLYRLTRWGLNARAREMFRRLVAKAIVRSGLRIASRAPGKSMAARGAYEPGDDFDIEETIERVLEDGRDAKWLSYDDIVGIRRLERENKAVVIIDASGSMSGEKITHAAVSASVAAHLLRSGGLAVIAFNNDAYILKRSREQASIPGLIERILDIVPMGYTNIRQALRLAKGEGESMGSEHTYLLITDGNYNVGGDPRGVAAKIRGLNVIFASGRVEGERGRRVCEELARAGGGRFVRLDRYSQIPHVVPELLIPR